MNLSRAFLLVLLTVAGSCTTFEQADLVRYSQAKGFPLTTEPLPPDSEPIRIVHVQEDGFYLLGVIPLVTVSLQSCLDRLVREATKAGADGIANVAFEVEPADIFKFSVFPLPDWSARIAVSGTSYKLSPPGAEIPRSRQRDVPSHSSDISGTSDTAAPETVHAGPAPDKK